MFESAKLKVERAKHHITDLEVQFGAFVEKNPYSVAVGHNPETGKATIRLVFKEKIPARFALIIGDAIHNLRTALDHIAWELIGHDGGTQDRYLKFPTGDNRVSFEASCQGIKTPSRAVRDLFQSQEVFPSGKGDILYTLHLLDIADKHTVLTPIIRAAKVSKLIIYHRTGQVQATLIDNIFAGDTGTYADIWNVPEGGYVEIDEDTKATPAIFLANVQGVPAQPVFPLLGQLRHATANTLDIISKAIS